MRRRRRTTDCGQAGQWISLRLDGELSELAQAALDRHLELCPQCTAVSAELAGIARLLREAPLVELDRELAVASRRRPRGRLLGRAAGAVAFASAVAGAAFLAISASRPAPVPSSAPPFRSTAEQIRFVRAEQHRLEPPKAAPAPRVSPQVASRSL